MSNSLDSSIAIRAVNLTRNFGDLIAVNNLDLEVEKGKIYGFLGPNGCGKTTSIRLLTGLLKATSGKVEVLGFTLPEDAEKLRLKIGYMTQKFALYDDLTINENLKFVARIYGLSHQPQQQRIAELLSVYDLEAKKNQLAGSLSGGQKQRLGLSAAVLHKPELLFLDEPTSAVDPENRREFWEQLFDLSDQGTTILVSTHYMDEAERCHKLAILEKGIKRADGKPSDLMSEMGSNVIEISSPEIRLLKKKLVQLSGVISAAQLGARLRVLIDKQQQNPIDYLRQQPFVAAEAEMEMVRPSLEDVFVTCTGQGKK